MTSFIFWLIFIQVNILVISGVLLCVSMYAGYRNSHTAMGRVGVAQGSRRYGARFNKILGR